MLFRFRINTSFLIFDISLSQLFILIFDISLSQRFILIFDISLSHQHFIFNFWFFAFATTLRYFAFATLHFHFSFLIFRFRINASFLIVDISTKIDSIMVLSILDCSVLSKLARVYMKKGWFDESINVINQTESDSTVETTSTTTSTVKHSHGYW